MTNTPRLPALLLSASFAGLTATPALAAREITVTGFVRTDRDLDGVVDRRPDVFGDIREGAVVSGGFFVDAVEVGSGATVLNDGRIMTSGESAALVAVDDLLLINSGTLGGFQGVIARDGLSVVNSGSLGGGQLGIRGRDDLMIRNSGSIGSGREAISGDNGGAIVNTGSIAGGGSSGFAVNFGDDLIIRNAGQITADRVALGALDRLLLENGGVIENSAGSNATLIFVGDDGAIVNRGAMTSTSSNVVAADYKLTIENSGVIEADFASLDHDGVVRNPGGALIIASGSVTNNEAGIISSQSSAAVFFGSFSDTNNAMDELAVGNRGLIEGFVGVEELSSPIPTTIRNEGGTIRGTAGTAIDLDLGADLVALAGGLVDGDVRLGRGADALSVTDGAVVDGDAFLGGGDDRLSGDRSLFGEGDALFDAGLGLDEAIFDDLSIAEVDFSEIEGGFLIALQDAPLAARFVGFERLRFTDALVTTGVSPVPLPAGAALLLGALGMLGAARRRPAQS